MNVSSVAVQYEINGFSFKHKTIVSATRKKWFTTLGMSQHRWDHPLPSHLGKFLPDLVPVVHSSGVTRVRHGSILLGDCGKALLMCLCWVTVSKLAELNVN